MSGRRIILGTPGYGSMTANCAVGLMRACADMTQVDWIYQNGSLLASNFNQLWCAALNAVRMGRRVDYFAMLHDDIGPEEYWLDMLIDELEAKQLDVLGAVVPIKDNRGMTSMALHHEGDNWMPLCRLSMHDVFQLPETFTSEDIGHPLLLNTGCWVCKFDMRWATQVHFTINDRIVFNKAENRYQAQTEPEDWYFSRLCHEQGLRIGATRKVSVKHTGRMDYESDHPWGKHTYDSEAVSRSPIPNAFPFEVDGWLTVGEGRKLAELATDKDVLEIGSYCGRSTICMARTANHVTAVDYFDGRDTPAPGDTLPTFTANLQRYGVSDKVETCHPEQEPTRPAYDMLFIDGAHDRESVQADVDKWINYLAPGGLIAFHDYHEPCHPGITEVVDSLVAAGGELVSVTDHLAVVKPAAVLLEV